MTVAPGLAPPIVVRGTRAAAVGCAIAAALMLAFLLFAARPWGGGPKPFAILGAAFFGALEILSLIAIAAPDRLEISPAGVLVRHLWLVRRFGWDQLSSFRLAGGRFPEAPTGSSRACRTARASGDSHPGSPRQSGSVRRPKSSPCSRKAAPDGGGGLRWVWRGCPVHLPRFCSAIE